MTEAHDIRVGRLKLHHLEDLDIHYVKTWLKWWLKTVNEKGTQEKDKVVLKIEQLRRNAFESMSKSKKIREEGCPNKFLDWILKGDGVTFEEMMHI